MPAANDSDLPPSSPPAPSEFSSPVRPGIRQTTPLVSLEEARVLSPIPDQSPALTSDGLIATSPIRGTKEQRKAIRRRKGARKRLKTIQDRRGDRAQDEEAEIGQDITDTTPNGAVGLEQRPLSPVMEDSSEGEYESQDEENLTQEQGTYNTCPLCRR